ncbi:MAG: hypothetical protein M3Q81_03475 [bacterium]|nr:hypothetical protein [bacterium]
MLATVSRIVFFCATVYFWNAGVASVSNGLTEGNLEWIFVGLGSVLVALGCLLVAVWSEAPGSSEPEKPKRPKSSTD